jgi:dTDP-glucose 4,6-dehydratase
MKKPLPSEDLTAIQNGVGDLWQRLSRKRLFLTGATGFFGRWLIESFLHANAALGLDAVLVCLSRKPDIFLEQHSWLKSAPALEWLRGDVRDFTFPEGDFTHIIHAATPVVLGGETGEEILDIIVRGTHRALAFAKTHPAARFLLTSSGAVYGRQPEDLYGFPENWLGGAPDPTATTSAYAEGKRVAETMSVCAADRAGFSVKIARCFACVGPGLALDAHFAAGNFIRDILAGNPPQLTGSAAVVRSYIYSTDLFTWLWRHLLGDGPPVLNIGSDYAVNLGRLANILIADHLPGEKKRYAEDTDGARYVPDITLARNAGFPLTVDLKEAFERTIRYNKK